VFAGKSSFLTLLTIEELILRNFFDGLSVGLSITFSDPCPAFGGVPFIGVRKKFFIFGVVGCKGWDVEGDVTVSLAVDPSKLNRN